LKLKQNQEICKNPLSKTCADFSEKYFGMPVNKPINNQKKLKVENFSKYSSYSIAFTGRRSIAGNEFLAKSAHESYWASYDDEKIPFSDIHTYVLNTVVALSNKNMLKLVDGKTTTTEYLSAKNYNMENKNIRKHDKNNTNEDEFREHCKFSNTLSNINDSNWYKLDTYIKSLSDMSKWVLDCRNSKDEKNNNRLKENNWRQLSFNNHHGVIVSKKP
jgi:hypothetical protein